MSTEKIYQRIPSKQELQNRFRIVSTITLALPVVIFVMLIVMRHELSSMVEGVGITGWIPDEFIISALAIYGFMFFAIIFILRTIHFVRGFDVPGRDYLKKSMHQIDESKDYADMMIRDNNYSIFGGYMFAVAVVYLLAFLVQWAIYGLWTWHPAAILTPVLVASPIVGIVYLRKMNRKKRLEQQEIMDKLSGKKYEIN